MSETSWAVVHRLHAGGRVRSVPRLIIVGVPTSVKRPAVIGALEEAGQTALYSDGGLPWANHVVVPELRWPEVWDAGGRVSTVTWASLETKKARRITLPLEPALWGRVKLAAAKAGLPAQTWAIEVLRVAAEKEAAG